MQTELEYGIDPPTHLLLQFEQGLAIPRVDHQRFFANCVSAYPQSKADVGIVQVVRRTDTNIVHLRFSAFALPSHNVPIEALKLSKIGNVEEELVKNTDRIMWIHGRYQSMACILDRRQMPRRNVASRSCHRKIHDDLSMFRLIMA